MTVEYISFGGTVRFFSEMGSKQLLLSAREPIIQLQRNLLGASNFFVIISVYSNDKMFVTCCVAIVYNRFKELLDRINFI